MTNTMTFTNAEAKLKKAGFVVTKNEGSTSGIHYATSENSVYVISFRVYKDGLCSGWHIARNNEQSDIATDYSPGSFLKNLTRAITIALGV
jgi:hypothetical protein